MHEALRPIGGFGTAGFGNMQSTLMLTEAPPEMRSRLMGVVTVCIGTGPLGQLAAGQRADFVAWDIERPADLAYWLGGDLHKRVVRHGVELTDKGEAAWTRS